MTKAISSEALELYPELKKDTYHCHCRNVFQCTHPSNMIEEDSPIVEKLVEEGKLEISRGSPSSFGTIWVRVPGTGGNLARWV